MTLPEYEADSKEYQDYLAAKKAYDEAYAKYLEEKAAYDNVTLPEYEADSKAYQDYLAAKKVYDEAYAKYLEEKAAYDNVTLPEYEADSKAYQDYLIAKQAYDKAHAKYLEEKFKYENETKPKYDQLVEENTIYDGVTEYNKDIEDKNIDIDNQNAALEDDVSAEDVDSITDAGTINAGVEVDETTMNTLKTYDALVKAQGDLEIAAAALENHEGKDAELGSEAYNQYLEAVKIYNQNVQEHNALITAYNEAVKTYNDAVKAFNDKQDANAGTSTSTGSQTGTGTADWGNVNIKNKYLNHIDVKYTAAVAKDKTVDADGSETSNESATQYTVVGVYVDEAAAKAHEEAKKNPRYNEEKDGIKYYGVSYKNNDESSTQTHSIQKDAANHEFGNPSHTGAWMNPGEGHISFYMTLQNGTTTQGIQVTMDANSVYPDGTYYHAASDDRLDLYVDSNGHKLQTVTIDGVEYYDISGQSVFVISALTCDGMTEKGHWEGYGMNRKWVVDSLTPNGLDLVVNVETLISITQANHAQNIKYLDLELGKTAQAEEPADPGEAPVAPTFDKEEPDVVKNPGEAPEAPTFDKEEPDVVKNPGEAPEAPTFDKEEPDVVKNPGEAPEAPTFDETEPDPVKNPGEAPEAPTFDEKEPDAVKDPGKAPEAPIFDKEEPGVVKNPGEAPEAPTFDEKEPDAVKDPGKAPEAPTFDEIEPDPVEKPGDEPINPGSFNQTEPEAPKPADRLDHAEKLEKLEEKKIFEVVEPTPDPEPQPNPNPHPQIRIHNNGLVEIDDEEVPLADAPKTGDLSTLLLAMSMGSAGGMAMLNRKKKEEE